MRASIRRHPALPLQSYNEAASVFKDGVDANRATVSRKGQISIPAHVRHRWGTRSVLVIDRGDYAIVRPIPDDPITALRGAHAGPGPSADAARVAERAEEAIGEDRRADRR
jgi:AbrB family looped-hinge helix DNA binding protein